VTQPPGGYDATVTVGAHDAQMPNRLDSPQPERVGALVLRAWLEGTPDRPQLRVRLVGRMDVTQDVEDTAAAATVDDALVLVRDWLTRFLSTAAQSPGRWGCPGR
jgi:hypothetical protein